MEFEGNRVGVIQACIVTAHIRRGENTTIIKDVLPIALAIIGATSGSWLTLSKEV